MLLAQLEHGAGQSPVPHTQGRHHLPTSKRPPQGVFPKEHFRTPFSY
jgi:hypothetical protein